MNVFDLFATLSLDDREYNEKLQGAQSNAHKMANALGTGLKTAAKVGAVAVGGVATAMTALGKIGTEYNAEMEGYTTNFETMLGSADKAAKKVDELRKFAASTPLSMANLADGTKTLLAFGVKSKDTTDILRQLGDIALGDADKMQRLATAFGKATAQGKVTGETVQQMIDAGFNPLIEISRQSGETMEEVQKRMSAGAVSVDELRSALKAVTSEGGQFAGGMEKASHTTQGLISTLQDNAKALVGEVFQPISDGILNDVLPFAIKGISKLSKAYKKDGVDGLVDATGDILEKMIRKSLKGLPKFAELAVDIVESITGGLLDNTPLLLDTAVQLIEILGGAVVEGAPQFGNAFIQLLTMLGTVITENAPVLLPFITQLIADMAVFVGENIDVIVEAAVQIIDALTNGLIASLPVLIDKMPEILTALVTGLIKSSILLLSVGAKLLATLAGGLIENLPVLIGKIPTILKALVDGFNENKDDWIDTGINIVEGLWEGIKQNWENLKSNVTQMGKDLVKGFKDLLGIHSPSKVFAQIGGYMAEGLGVGFDDKIAKVNRDINNGINVLVSTPKMRGEKIRKDDTYDLLKHYLPLLADLEVKLDGDATVGKLAPKMNRKLGEIADIESRGVTILG